MSLLYINDDDNENKVNIDDLYEKKKIRDLKQISIFNKILNRIQNRIRITGRSVKQDKHIWFTIPEYIFGEPVYDKGECIGYIITKLEENGFYIRYIHPNTLFVSWSNWVPTYVRNELKKKRGMVIDERGNVLETKVEKEEDDNMKLLNNKTGEPSKKEKDQKQFNSISNYKPTGNLIYNEDMFKELEKKVTFYPTNTQN
jgi:hypothetical protein